MGRMVRVLQAAAFTIGCATAASGARAEEKAATAAQVDSPASQPPGATGKQAPAAAQEGETPQPTEQQAPAASAAAESAQPVSPAADNAPAPPATGKAPAASPAANGAAATSAATGSAPAAAAGVAATAGTAVTEPADERLLPYKVFREHFQARRFAEARDAAQQVVDLSLKHFGADDLELVVPLTNLATCQVRLQDYAAAERNYQRAVKIVEMQEGGLSRRILTPLLGLGTLYYAAQQYEQSIEVLRRAVDTSRKIDGLFNMDQLNLVQVLIETYVAMDMIEDAEREHQFALRLNESVYGSDDLRLLPALDRLAAWREFTGRYRLARQAHARALDIVRHQAGKRDPRIVKPLRGIARTYRMEYLYGSYEDDMHLKSMTSGVGTTPVGSAQILSASEPRRTSSRLDPDGLDALKLAIEILAELPESAVLRGETLLDMGDWYQISNDPRTAFKTYREAWKVLSAEGGPGTEMMEHPVQIYYKAPSSATRRESTETREIVPYEVVCAFTVARDGRVTDVRTVSSDPPEQAKSLEIALRRARYRPRFENGEPVDTPDQRWGQTLYVAERNTTSAGT